MAPSAEGWYSRATPHPSAPDFTPTKDELVFAVLLNAQADPEGFTLAVFRPDIAVDARGRVLQLQPQDFSSLTSLAEETTRLPETGSFMNAWRVDHPVTSRPIDQLFYKTESGEYKQTSVQGWSPDRKQLKSPVGDYQELPPLLQELFGYVQEARTDYERGREENPALLEKVKELVPRW
ncbi:hypothetical protein C8Q76DRAFT_786155 [Earliella scabrosa]|nr:hypothetical protein C8Q76DRAFT_786155 [Earliella scabrosa]